MTCRDLSDYVCIYSPQGCTLHTKVLLRAVQSLHTSAWYMPVWGPFLDWYVARIPPEQPRKDLLGDNLLRAFLFNKLDLSRTCCENEDWGWPADPLDDSELQAVYAEPQKERAALFKRLLPLAIDRWKAYSGPFSEFLSDFVQSEMKKKIEDWNAEYARKAEEIRVKEDRLL